jgi:hypothetical protein
MGIRAFLEGISSWGRTEDVSLVTCQDMPPESLGRGCVTTEAAHAAE